MVDNKNSLPEIFRVRYHLTNTHPYYASLLFSLIPIDVGDKIPTIRVDKHLRLYFNPKILQHTQEEIKGIFVHELKHVMNGHFLRFGARDPWQANEAGDLAINCEIRDEGLKLPSYAIYPDLPEYKFPVNLTMEEYYDLLTKKKKEDEKDGKGKGKSNEGKKAAAGRCGSAGGATEDFEVGDVDEKGNKVDKIDEYTREAIINKVAQDIIEHSRNIGNIPGNLERWAKDRMKEKVNWRHELRTQISNCVNYTNGLVDFTRSKVNRRQSAFGKILIPAFHAPVPHIGIIIDTSGSMGNDDLAQTLAETAAVLKTFRTTITVMSYDTQLSNMQKVFNAGSIALKGGGGTAMDRAVEEAAQIKPRFDFIILLTDGETAWPSKPIERPKVITALVRKPYSENDIPSWMKVIRAYERA